MSESWWILDLCKKIVVKAASSSRSFLVVSPIELCDLSFKGQRDSPSAGVHRDQGGVLRNFDRQEVEEHHGGLLWIQRSCDGSMMIMMPVYDIDIYHQ